MKLFIRILILIIVFAAGLLVGFGWMQKPAVAPTTSEERGARFSVELMLDYGNGKIQTFNDIDLNPGQTVFNLLEKVTQEHELEFSFKDYGANLGAFIESINKVRNDPVQDMFWHYWVNNHYAQLGASSYQLTDGDVVMWKYTKSQYNN
jgi:hypothetical protein